MPPNTVLLLKSVLLRPIEANAWAWYLFAVSPVDSATVTIAQAVASVSTPASWSGWVALNAGDQVALTVTGADVQYWISGAVLPYNPPTV